MSLSNIRVVLVEPKHPGNIGAAARAMKTMGLDQLVLVRPRRFSIKDANDRAVGAVDVLDRAQTTDDLKEAVLGCKLVIGTSARKRELPLPGVDAREAGVRLVREAALGDPVALLFGSEQYGLSNESLDACTYQLRIPTNPEFTSLNLASAVQLVCYEIWMAAAAAEPVDDPDVSAYPSHEELEYFYETLFGILEEQNFAGPINPERINSKIRRLLTRARPRGNELQLLHGLVRLMRVDPKNRR